MKQFNLEEYLENPSRKVITRDGRNARIVCTDAKTTYPLVAVVEKNKDEEFVLSFLKDGRFIRDTISREDLFFAPEKHEGYVNLLKDLNGNAFIGDPSIYKSKEDAERGMENCSNYIAAAKIEWEE